MKPSKVFTSSTDTAKRPRCAVPISVLEDAGAGRGDVVLWSVRAGKIAGQIVKGDRKKKSR